MKRETQEQLARGATAALIATSLFRPNALGPVGIALADGLYAGVGGGAWLLLGCVIDDAVSVARRRPKLAHRRLRWLGGVLLACTALDLFGGFGGRIGALLGTTLAGAIGFGAHLLVLAAVLWTLAQLLGRSRVELVRTHVAGAWARADRRLAAARTARELPAEIDDGCITVVLTEPQPARVAPPPLPVRTRVVAPGIPVVAQPAQIKPSEGYRAATAYRLPSTSLLSAPTPRSQSQEQQDLARTAYEVELELLKYDVKCKVHHSRRGPVVDLFELSPAPGVTAAAIRKLGDELDRIHRGARVISLPGSGMIGLEVPRPEEQRRTIALREIVEHHSWRNTKHALPLTLGLKTDDEPVIVDLEAAPHLLVAGTTGSGKSVGLHAMLLSLLLRNSPADLRLAMIDPKMVELAAYRGLPHLIANPATEDADAMQLLQHCCEEMDRRYQCFADVGVTKLADYNARHEPMPRWVVVIDEYADLALSTELDFQKPVTRLAQKARAAGIHLIVATQRPSVDVITGVIKANFPSRLAYKTVQVEDSRTILGTTGAQRLLGHGDSLCLIPSLATEFVRTHGAYVSPEDIRAVCDAWRTQVAPATTEVSAEADEPDEPEEQAPEPARVEAPAKDPEYERALQQARLLEAVSARRLAVALQVRYDRAATYFDRMKQAGLLEPGPNKTWIFVGPN